MEQGASVFAAFAGHASSTSLATALRRAVGSSWNGTPRIAGNLAPFTEGDVAIVHAARLSAYADYDSGSETMKVIAPSCCF